MRVAVSSTGDNLDAQISPVFGRCPVYLFVDTETMQFQAAPNPAVAASGGAGIQAAQFVAGQEVQAVISGNLGPNAFQVLQAAGLPVYTAAGGTVREAVEAYKAGRLFAASGATAAAHAGMGSGMGRGGGQGRGLRQGPVVDSATTASSPGTPTAPSREELASLKGEVRGLKKRLDDILERLEQL